jgi:hypothetical protein
MPACRIVGKPWSYRSPAWGLKDSKLTSARMHISGDCGNREHEDGGCDPLRRGWSCSSGGGGVRWLFAWKGVVVLLRWHSQLPVKVQRFCSEIHIRPDNYSPPLHQPPNPHTTPSHSSPSHLPTTRSPAGIHSKPILRAACRDELCPAMGKNPEMFANPPPMPHR